MVQSVKNSSGTLVKSKSAPHLEAYLEDQGDEEIPDFELNRRGDLIQDYIDYLQGLPTSVFNRLYNRSNMLLRDLQTHILNGGKIEYEHAFLDEKHLWQYNQALGFLGERIGDKKARAYSLLDPIISFNNNLFRFCFEREYGLSDASSNIYRVNAAQLLGAIFHLHRNAPYSPSFEGAAKVIFGVQDYVLKQKEENEFK